MARRAPDLPVYRAKRDFSITSEPRGSSKRSRSAPIFVVHKHAARRLHWDLRLEHGGVLWSWAVPKGPSADTADKRLAVHVEDHPLEYADFEGTIPAGQYGAGSVEIWDRGTWAPVGDPEEGLANGELKFSLRGKRLSGGYVLVRLKAKAREKAENWLLIKEHDGDARPGEDAGAMERTRSRGKTGLTKAPAKGAVKGTVPADTRPQLARLVDQPPSGDEWLFEIKFDGYRLLVFKTGSDVRMITRNGHDWTNRLPVLAAEIARLAADDLVLDGELVAQREDGVSSFALLQQAFSDRKTGNLLLYAFDCLQLNGWDLRPCPLEDRKALLQTICEWNGGLRYSDHHRGQGGAMRRLACEMGLEGVIAKQANAPYRAGRGTAWLKLKCQGRDEFVVLGWMPPEGARSGIGSLQLGYYDQTGTLHYAGGVGTGFAEKELVALRRRLDSIATATPEPFRFAVDPPDRAIRWVKPELVAEVQFAGWSGHGRLRHAVYLGVREDKAADEVVREIADPEAARQDWPMQSSSGRIVHAPPAARRAAAASRVSSSTRIVSHAPASGHLTHPDRELWPGITKRDLAEYWDAVASAALPEIANRPLALVRCPDGIGAEHFFQKHRSAGFSDAIQAGEAGGAPYLFITGADGLQACAQMSAIELHGWGATLDDPLHPDRMTFDLDPGDGVTFPEVVDAALDLRERLSAMKLDAFCRTTGGKGLHVVVPLRPAADWDAVKSFCRSFAETLAAEQPDRFVSVVSKAQRKGRILIDWLRNGLGATAVVSFSPRAREGAGVATPLAWREVTRDLKPDAFTLRDVPRRLSRQRSDPWKGFGATDNRLPDVPAKRRR
jgi:bifunctional non-homologous end joining protein LigD